MKNIVFLICILFAVAACKTEEIVVEETQTENVDLTKLSSRRDQVKKYEKPADVAILTFERTWCFGTCPVYSVTVYKSGKAVYTGKANVENVGEFEGMMTQTEIEKLQGIANRIKYASFDEKYDNNISDIPACYTGVLIDGKMVTVQRRGPGPDGLTAFEKAFDAAILNVNWTEKK